MSSCRPSGAGWMLLLLSWMGACAPSPRASGPPTEGTAEADPSWTDGSFQEWAEVDPLETDRAGDVPAESAVDLVAVRGLADGRFIHLLLDVGRVVTAQGLRGVVEILVDGDGDPGTGIAMDGLAGADLVVVLSRPSGSGADFGAGVGAALVRDGTLGDVESSYRIGLLVSPTHSSNRFEVRLTRGSELGPGIRLAEGQGVVRGLVRYLSGGVVVDRLGPFTLAVPAEVTDASPTVEAAALAAPTGTFRVVAWNVSDDSFREAEGAFQRVLGALRPDVVLLDEVFEEVTDGDLASFFAGVPGDPAAWQWWIAEGGGPQRTVVASPRSPVRGEPSLARVAYPDSALDRWSAAAGGSPAVRAKADVERSAGLSATGAWVEIGGVPILFVPVDLQSAGHDGSPQDELRVLQAETLNTALARVVGDHPSAGLVIGGDLNLVGSDRPLQSLIRGLEEGDRDLAVARAPNGPDRSLVTWRSTGTADAFSPGRLDYVLYRDSRLEAVKSFVFDAAQVAGADRPALGVREADSRVTSDHLPVVVDFRVR